MNTTELVIEIRPEKNSGLYGIWTHGLWRYRCSALPTELTSQLGADHYVRPELHLCSRIDFQTNAQEAQAQHAFNALTIAPSGEGLKISNASKLTYLTLPLGVVQFFISLVGLQTELDSTQSYHHH